MDQWRKEEAERLLSSQLLKEFFTDYEEHLKAMIANSEPMDYEGREHNYKLIRVLKSFRQHFEKYLFMQKL